ncbi:MAG: UDP-N-acetylmuramoyl-L-alanyl-D-glutamate--2,6-diaminopimelate ligase [Thermoleophilia bacterium]|nr:UDP-N-acetylmuramoyl-L-alanyl-D-glutamate--2,6-diaminopimelate ligase [Thermoleophilia bacterium]
MDLERVIAALAPTEVANRAPVEVRDLAYDARAVVSGTLFFCVPGSRADGHEFAPAAVGRGAAALVVERPVDADVPQLVVPSARAAMAVVADEFFGRPSQELEVAGVTGTNGKTTTAHLLYAVLAAGGRRPGLLGTVEARVGGGPRKLERTTPEAIDLQRLFREMLDAGDRSCAMEASSHASELHRLDRVRFRVLVFTNLTQDHLDFHGTMEAYFAAKRRLFDGVPAVVNIDDPWGRRLVAELGGEAVTFGRSADAEVGPEGLAGVELRLRGRFNVLNALGATAAARVLGIEPEAVKAGLEAVAGVPGRFEEVSAGQPFVVLVDYAHTPDSLELVLREARELAEGRVLCVFGCGGDRDREKRPLMGRVATELADLAVVTSDNPRSEEPETIVAEVLAGAAGGAVIEPDRRAAIELAVEAARPGDVVVVAGKGHEQGQEVGGVVTPFDDREVAREALRKLVGARA